MANALLPAEWKKVLKDHKDAPETGGVTRALDAFAKVEPKAKDNPQPVLDSLEKVVAAAKSAKSANAKDKTRKPVVEFLNGVLDDAATMKVKAERFLQEKNERDREGEDTDEGGDNERPKLTERLLKVKKLTADAAKPFVLALGKKSHGLVIAKTAALSADHKKRARAMRDGSGKVFTGLVYGEGGKYVFQMEEVPPRGLAKAIKKAAATHTDLPSIRVILRGPGGVELDDETDVEEMDDLGTDTDTDTGTDDLTAQWTEALAERTPSIEAAMAAKGPNAAAIARLFDQAVALSKPGGNLPLALEKLTESHELATSDATRGGESTESAQATEDGDPTALFNDRLKRLMPLIKAASGTPAGAEARRRAGEATLFAARRNFARANQSLVGTAVALKAAQRATNGAAGEVPVGKVGLEILRLELRQVRMQVLTGVTELIAKLRASGAPQSQPIAAVIQKLAVGLPRELETILQQFDAAVKANSADGVSKARGDVQPRLQKLVGLLEGECQLNRRVRKQSLGRQDPDR